MELAIFCFLVFLMMIPTSGEGAPLILFIGKKISITFLGNNLTITLTFGSLYKGNLMNRVQMFTASVLFY